MLAPAFIKPRDAWDFYRGAGPAEAVAAVIEQLPRQVGPVCSCGLKSELLCLTCRTPIPRHCPQHEPGTEPHRCAA